MGSGVAWIRKMPAKQYNGHRDHGLLFYLALIFTVVIRHSITKCGYPGECQTHASENISEWHCCTKNVFSYSFENFYCQAN